MRSPILIPEAASYGIAILVLYSLASFSLAAQIHARWLAPKRVSFILTHCLVMAGIVAWGLLIFEPSVIFGRSPTVWALSVPLGVVAGAVSLWGDRLIVLRLLRREALRAGPRFSAVATESPRQRRDVPEAGPPTRRKTIGVPRLQQELRPADERRFGFMPLVLAAALEELVYRGLLVQTCFLLPNRFWVAVGLAATTMFFSLSHLPFGWPQVFAKFPLGVCTTALAVALGSVTPAIVAHLVFNIKIWKDLTDAPVVAAGVPAGRNGIGVLPGSWS